MSVNMEKKADQIEKEWYGEDPVPELSAEEKFLADVAMEEKRE